MGENWLQRVKLRHQRLLGTVQEIKRVIQPDTSEDVRVSVDWIIGMKIKLKQEIEKLESEVQNYLGKATEIDSEASSKFMKDQLVAEDTLIGLQTLYTLNIASEQEKSCKTNTKLPKINLEKFDGNVQNWPEFWAKFENSVHKQPISKAEKLTYLVSSMTGPAYEAIQGIAITEENYEIAFDILKKRFGDKTLVIDRLYTSLNNIPKTGNIRQTYDSINRHLRLLKNMGEDINGNYFKNLIFSKFPENVLYELNILIPSEKTIENILLTIEKIVTAKERSTHNEGEGSSNDTALSRKGGTTDALHIRAQDKNRHNKKRKMESTHRHMNKRIKMTECAFCKGSHYNDTCRVYKTYKERINKIGRNCYKCLQPGHVMRQCRSFIKHCVHCKGLHHRALCKKKFPFEAPKAPVRKAPETSVAGNEVNVYRGRCSNILYNRVNGITYYLQTATATLKNNDIATSVRLLLDSGSQRSYLSESQATKLRIIPDHENTYLIYTFGADKPYEMICPSAEVLIRTKRGTQKPLRVNIVPHITDKIPITYIGIDTDIDLTADDDSLGERVDLWIGNDYYFSFMRHRSIQLTEDFFLVDTEFGWTTAGHVHSHGDNDLSIVTYCQGHESCPYYAEPDLPLRDTDMRFLWSLESIGIVDSPKTTHQEQAVKHFNDTVRYNSGRYEVKWPWIEFPPAIPTNFGLALGRLKSLLKRADQGVIHDYKEILDEQLKMGIIEIVDPESFTADQKQHPVHYLSTHMVKQTGKRGRIVCDAAAKQKEEKSLNECMYKGPSLLEDLNALLLKFRTGKIGITADVEKAFLQVGLQPDDRDVTRFLWVKDTEKEVTSDNLIHYRFCRVPFGVISSPFLLTATIRHHLASHNEHLLKRVADRCYVDNLVTEAKTVDEAVDIYKETRKAFEELSMNIRDWTSNNSQFLRNIPPDLRAKENENVKVLGLNWNLREDTLQLRVPELGKEETSKVRITKRDVLRTMARIYDPCGFASPMILSAKLFFQQTCVRKLKWNSELPPDMVGTWKDVIEVLQSTKSIEVPRYIGKDLKEEKVSFELHCFTDASLSAYASVVYIVSRGEGNSVTAFLMSKSRVTPVEDKSDLKIPRLELLGVLIGSRLLKYVAENLDLPISRKYLWTDSMIVLAWMKSNKLLPPFVSRRINEIKTRTDVNFRYVPTDNNPADIATRPGSIASKEQLWFEGPGFLQDTEETWPQQPVTFQQVLLSAGEALNLVDGPEMVTRGYEEEVDEVLQDIMTQQNVEEQDLQLLELRDLQRQHFPEECSGKVTSLTRNLGLYLDEDQILRCKGRMDNTDWSYDKKNPILIPKDSEFTRNLILKIHESNFHVGVAHTLSLIRQKYWIPQGRAQVQRIIKTCSKCIKHGGGPYKLPNTPSLPVERVTLTTPYAFTGMDYFGPAFVQTSEGKEKRWICLFTCLAVRAIHLEVVNDLSAEQCLLGLRRFVAIRGRPKLIVSDNATQFKLTSEIMSDAYCTEKGIRWKFIPQLAPWHGGVYERLIGLVKSCLKRTLEKHLLNDSQLITIMKEVEAVVNTRPLTTVGSEVEHVLRPVDFLSPGNCLELTPIENAAETGTATKIDLLKSWKRGRTILAEFKKMFHDQYLPNLRERYRQYPKQPRVTSDRIPKVGDIVQIKEDCKNRNNWKVGKVSELIEGQDGQCRVAKVKVGNAEFTRSIGHLYPLEVEEDSSNTMRVDGGSGTVVVPMVENIHEDLERMELEDLHEVDLRQEDISNDKTHHIDELLEGEHELVDSPPMAVVEDSVDLGDSNMRQLDVSQAEPDVRAKREAAIRAREKIAEWTRHLLCVL